MMLPIRSSVDSGYRPLLNRTKSCSMQKGFLAAQKRKAKEKENQPAGTKPILDSQKKNAGAAAHTSSSSDDDDPLILSSGAIVCKHQLEVCGACGIDFRDMNKERGIAVPPPEAPAVGTKEIKPATKLEEIDPSTMKKWSQEGGKLEKTFVNCFSMQEKFGSYTGDRPVNDTNYDMRESMVVIAKMLDTTQCKSITIQDDVQSNALCIKIISCLESKQDDGSSVPILMCHYQTNSVSAPDFMAKMQHMAAALKSAHGVQNIPTSRAEVEGFTQLLQRNQSLLAASYKSAHATACPPTFHLSFLAPLKARLKGAVALCFCGDKDATLRCSRCGLASYCSKECQRADWKRHKGECAPPRSKSQQGEAVVVKMLDGIPGPNKFLSTVSLNQPLGQAAQKIQNTHEPSTAKDGVVRIVKVQTPAERGESMLVYDKTKVVQTMIHPGNTAAAGYNELFDLIQRRGEAGGRKGYFNAAVMSNGRELHVYAKEMLGLQPW